jgi:hypothetical protein
MFIKETAETKDIFVKKKKKKKKKKKQVPV